MPPAEYLRPEDLFGDLRVLLKAGLPVRLERCGSSVLALRGVRARALQPDDPGSQARALDALLREQLDRLENAELADAAPLLFGAHVSTSGATLTARRDAAAKAAGFEVHHFRKRIEPKMLELIALQLQRDSEDFTVRHAEPPGLRARQNALQLPEDVFAWEAAEHQEAIARLWAAVYGLRGELLRVARLVSMAVDQGEVVPAADAALWRHAMVLAVAEQYRAAYGSVLLHAATELGPTDIAAYAGWTPPLTEDQKRLVVHCMDLEGSHTEFVDRLRAAGGDELMTTWRLALISTVPAGSRGRPS
ncbi:hypothetical protein J4573_29195 [Actinomadura barringtoniae]|uniref:Uncharacterized protein n=1 Tax=Actinomadura barringtoniae TaxID=1427535 RepID=A0A939PMC6_9ACTN|nr:hypothetical protein [Actinomadura barringtoniae]MBO2451201.1 hypothetical protein [Actinomadura barringtoniae]